MSESNQLLYTWRKSSYSPHDPDDCVELAASTDEIGIRDSKHRGSGPVLHFNRSEIRAFFGALKTDKIG